MNISSKIFHRRVAKPFQFFPTKHYGNVLTGTKIAFFEQYLALASITAGPPRVVNISTVKYRL